MKTRYRNSHQISGKIAIILIAVFLLTTFMVGCADNPSGDKDAPTVNSTVPSDSAVDVSSKRDITATFSTAMDSATISDATFTLKKGTTTVGAAVTYTGTTATFNPSSNLDASTVYTATVTTGAADTAGSVLSQNHSWSFTTGNGLDTTAPTVFQTSPVNDATGAAINGAITAIFSETMYAPSISTSTFTLKQGTTTVSGTVTYTGKTATFKPSSNLALSTLYTATVTTGAEDLASNALAQDHSWSFTTGATLDTTAPTVSLTVPVSNATGIAINKAITATFDETMDPATITTGTFTVTKPDLTSVAGTVTYLGRTATFTPTSNLTVNTIYTVTVKTGATDVAANALAANYVWTFTTGTDVALGPARVNLGTAGGFVILAKSLISTATVTTAIVGNLGISPAAASYIHGFSLIADASNVFSTSPVIVTGKIYAADYAPPTPSNMTTAISDMELAYTDAAGRVTPDFTNLGAGDIGGLTLVAGLYNWGTSLAATTDFTISGGANDIWIFQVAGDLTVSNAVIVTLSGGALPKNIFWQVAGQVALGTTANFKGIILSKTQIALNTGAVINGRLLAQTQVTLDANPVTQPAD